MSKGVRGRSFDQMFASVNSFHADVNYDQAQMLGEVYETDEDHEGRMILRVRRHLPKGVDLAKVCFVRPWQREMSRGEALRLAMDYGFRPAIHHEGVRALKTATTDQMEQLFDLADRAVRDQAGARAIAPALSVTCLGSCVIGKTRELIPVQEVIRSCGRPCRLHLRDLDPDASMFPAEMMALVST